MTRYSWAPWLASLSLLATACGDDEGEGLSSNPKTCASNPNPTIITLENLDPAIGDSVPNANIHHGFLVIDAPGLFETFAFVPGAGHTAGSVEPDNVINFTITPEGDNLRYDASGNSWSMEGEVELSVSTRYELGDGSCFAFQSPLWSYTVTADPGTGGGGNGGTGGNGGMGGSASGGGGAGGN